MRFKSAVLLFLYRILTSLLVVPGACYLAYHRRRDPHYGKGFWQLLGLNLPYFPQGCVVFHAASMGEANAINPLIRSFKERHPEINVVATTMTTTGAGSLKGLKDITVCFSPLDNYFCIRSFFAKLRPRMIITADTELWPEKFVQAQKNSCKCILVNARMQEKNCLAYLKYKNTIEDLISSKLTLVLCASEADRERYIRIGIAPENIRISGNLKYDLKPDGKRFKHGLEIKEHFKGPALGAISTHSGEETLMLQCFADMQRVLPNLSLILVPRHRQGAELAEKYLQAHKLSYVIKNEKDNTVKFSGGILVGNTVGEIALYFGMCDLVFMGGSFTETGGHNPLEPACHALPSVTGPDYHNFKSEYARLIDAGGAFAVKSEDELKKLCIKLLSDHKLCQKAGQNANEVLRSGQGALQRTMTELEYLL